MKNRILAAMTLALVTLLAGCANTQQGSSEQAGLVVGGIVGGLLGSKVGKGSGRTAAIILGTMAGAIIGGRVGQSMDATDRMRTSQALETVRDDEPTTWRNPNSGYEYTVVPTKTIEYDEGPCREYTMEANIGGQMETVYGTACRQPDGSWKTES